jgi:hypothetical protein
MHSFSPGAGYQSDHPRLMQERDLIMIISIAAIDFQLKLAKPGPVGLPDHPG